MFGLLHYMYELKVSEVEEIDYDALPDEEHPLYDPNWLPESL